MKELVTKFYKKRIWGGSGETVSGSGSTMAYTENIREALPRLIDDLGVSILLDAPCGDCNWIKSIVWKRATHYIGADIVESLIEINQDNIHHGSREFVNMDITTDRFPKADAWLCRDCFIHFSYADIWKAIHNFLKSDIPYLLASNYPTVSENYDIATGEYREVSLKLPPFSFVEPLLTIDDWIPGFPKKQLALWRADDLRTGVKT